MSRSEARPFREVYEKLATQLDLHEIYQGQPEGAMLWNTFDSGRAYFVGFFYSPTYPDHQKLFVRVDSDSNEATFSQDIMSDAPHLMGQVMPRYVFSDSIEGRLNIKDIDSRQYFVTASEVIEPSATLSSYLLQGLFSQDVDLSMIPLFGTWALQSTYRIYQDTTTSEKKGYIPTDRKPDNCLLPIKNPKVLQIDFGEATREQEPIPIFFTPDYVPLTFYQHQPLLTEDYMTSQLFSIVGNLYLETFKRMGQQFIIDHPGRQLTIPDRRPTMLNLGIGKGKSAHQELSDLLKFESNQFEIQEGIAKFRQAVAEDFNDTFDEFFQLPLATCREFSDYQKVERFGEQLKEFLRLGYGFRDRFPGFAESMSILHQLHRLSKELPSFPHLAPPPLGPDEADTVEQQPQFEQ